MEGPSSLARLHRTLRGGADARLPIGEVLHPVALAALVVLLVNDWILKPAGAPRWLAGKLSDVAGLAIAPLVLTASVGLALALAARLGARRTQGPASPGHAATPQALRRTIDPWLTRRRLVIAIALTGAVFAAVKLVPQLAVRLAGVWGSVAPGARVEPDPTDLVTLPALAIAWWIGRRELDWIYAARSARSS